MIDERKENRLTDKSTEAYHDDQIYGSKIC